MRRENQYLDPGMFFQKRIFHWKDQGEKQKLGKKKLPQEKDIGVENRSRRCQAASFKNGSKCGKNWA